jgi:hypothetical protein
VSSLRKDINKIGFFARKYEKTPAIKEPLPERGNSGKVMPKS